MSDDCGLLECFIRDLRKFKLYLIPASLVLASIITWLLRINSHPFIVLWRVSVPYPSVSVNALVTLAVSLSAVVSALLFMNLGKCLKLLIGVSLIIIVVGLITSVITVSGLVNVAMPLMSLYAACVPFVKVLMPVMAILSIISLCLLVKTRVSVGPRSWLSRETEVFGIKGGLRPIEALIAWLSAFIILMIPYLPWLNPHGYLIDVDHIYYIRWLRNTNWGNLWSQLASFCNGDRVAFLVPLYLVSRVIPLQQLDKLYIAGASALIPVLAESITRKLGIKAWLGYISAMLASIPLYFVYGGYHANLAALLIALAALNYRLGRESVSSKSLLIISILSLITVLTHSEAWVLYVPLFITDALTLTAWIIPGITWLGVREAILAPHYTKLAHNLLMKGTPIIVNPKLLNFQLIVMLWGVPATWLTYLITSTGLLLLTGKAITNPRNKETLRYLPFIASVTLTVIPLITSIAKFVTHRIIMNTAYWVVIAYALNQAWRGRHRWVIYIYIGLQSMYVVWLLVNAVPKV